jgi:hypothetical protein
MSDFFFQALTTRVLIWLLLLWRQKYRLWIRSGHGHLQKVRLHLVTYREHDGLRKVLEVIGALFYIPMFPLGWADIILRAEKQQTGQAPCFSHHASLPPPKRYSRYTLPPLFLNIPSSL